MEKTLIKIIGSQLLESFKKIFINLPFFKNNPKNRILFEKLDIKKVNFHKSYREFSNLIDFSSSRKIKFFKIPTKQIFKRYEFNNLGLLPE